MILHYTKARPDYLFCSSSTTAISSSALRKNPCSFLLLIDTIVCLFNLRLFFHRESSQLDRDMDIRLLNPANIHSVVPDSFEVPPQGICAPSSNFTAVTNLYWFVW